MHRLILAALVCVFAVAAGVATAGGPSPGLSFGAGGVATPDGSLRYVALPAGSGTIVESIGARSGRVFRSHWLQGGYGVPLVTFGGTAGGLSHDGKTLVLASFPGAPGRSVTHLAVLSTKTLRPRALLALRGSFSYDAIAPDGSTIYLIQYTSAKYFDRYRVRAYDLAVAKLLPGAIVDKREPKEPMTGSPVTRVTSADGGWVYTLYSRADKSPFIHALDAAHRAAVCIDLDWRGSQSVVSRLRLKLSADGRQLVLSRRDGMRVLAVAAPG